ncbi:MAG: hypothetical protein LBR52_04595 [Prevotellaceae bacterium]|jgi:hypothetical protein|nr:hypothetical protein [Prevotellaceae bacterium]
MKNKIESTFDAKSFKYVSFADKQLYVADYTERTNSVRSVEVLNVKPTDVDALIIQNPAKINISTAIFTSHCFIDKNGEEPPQCECIMYPTVLSAKSFLLFIEIKDCKPKNAANYHSEAKEKIISNVQLFRDKEIIDNDKIVYAVVSFPRKAKTNFHNHLIKASEWKRFRDDYRIMIKGTNEITVKNEKSIS